MTANFFMGLAGFLGLIYLIGSLIDYLWTRFFSLYQDGLYHRKHCRGMRTYPGDEGEYQQILKED